MYVHFWSVVSKVFFLDVFLQKCLVPNFATHAVCKIESVARCWPFMGRLKFQGQMSQKKHISREVNYS